MATSQLLKVFGPIVIYEFNDSSNGNVITNQFLDMAAPNQVPQGTETLGQQAMNTRVNIWRVIGTFITAGAQSCTMRMRVNGVSQASTVTTVGAAAGSVVTNLATAIQLKASDFIGCLFLFTVADATATQPFFHVVGVLADSY